MLEAVDHIDLKVPDLEQAVAWFAGLGLVERRRLPERKSVELALPGEGQVVFELREDATLEAFVIDHVAFRSRSQATDAAAIEAESTTSSVSVLNSGSSDRTGCS